MVRSEITSKTKENVCDTAFHMAIQKGHINFVELLLKNGANVNITSGTESGVTPLHEAAYYGRVDIIKLLIVHKAIVDAKDRHNFTPLQHACSNGKLEAVELLSKENEKYKKAIEMLLQNGADPHLKDE